MLGLGVGLWQQEISGAQALTATGIPSLIFRLSSWMPALMSGDASNAVAVANGGTLSAQFESLRRDIDASERRAGAENRETDEKRAVVHRRMDEIISEVGDIKTDIATIGVQVTDSKKVTDEVKKWKLMGIGALGVVGLAGAALGVTLANSVEWVVRLFHR